MRVGGSLEAVVAIYPKSDLAQSTIFIKSEAVVIERNAFFGHIEFDFHQIVELKFPVKCYFDAAFFGFGLAEGEHGREQEEREEKRFFIGGKFYGEQ